MKNWRNSFMNKVLNYVGLASRGRFIAFGEDALLLAKPNQVIFLAKDASESTKDKVLFDANKKKVPVIADFTKEELAHATWKKSSGDFINQKSFVSATNFKNNQSKGE